MFDTVSVHPHEGRSNVEERPICFRYSLIIEATALAGFEATATVGGSAGIPCWTGTCPSASRNVYFPQLLISCGAACTQVTQLYRITFLDGAAETPKTCAVSESSRWADLR